MKYNTRFNPTISGPLHVGHLYVALVNEAEAHRTDGKFIVRVDDTERTWKVWMKKKQQDQYNAEYQEQLKQFMRIDAWHRQSEMPTPEEVIGEHPLLNAFPVPFLSDRNIEYQEKLNRTVWVYNPCQTVEKIIWDFYERTNLLIRGEDLLSEANLYEHFTKELGLPTVYQIYLPRLLTEDIQDFANISATVISESVKQEEVISKTAGTYTLANQLDKFGVEEILYWLRQSCLIDPKGEFLVDNIKPHPMVKGLEK